MSSSDKVEDPAEPN